MAHDNSVSLFPPTIMQSGNDQDSDERGEYARVNRVVLSKKSDEYRQRRERNNAAVKKSRFKSKQKTIETQRRVEQLKSDNEQLERRLESLSREFHLMRDIFIPRRDIRAQAMQFQPRTAIDMQPSEQAMRSPLPVMMELVNSDPIMTTSQITTADKRPSS